MAFLTYSSELLAELNITTTADQNRAAALIDAAEAFIVTYCRRNFVYQTYDKVFPIKAGSIVYLDSYPVDTVIRVVTDRTPALTVSSSAQVVCFSTSDTACTLYTINNGVASTTTLNYSSYPTLSALATAISGVSTWTATVASNYGSFPSADVYPGLVINLTANQTGQVDIWSNSGGNLSYQVNRDCGHLRVMFGNFWIQAGVDPGFGLGIGAMGGYGEGALDYLMGEGAYEPYGYLGDMYRNARVVWKGGYQTLPDDLLKAEAELVKFFWDDKRGLMKSEKLGYYEYEVSDKNLARIPITTAHVLSNYRRRLI